MILGFTGSERGMTQRQRDTVRYLFHELAVTEFHHGDCIGADAQAHRLAKEFGARVVVHPPVDPRHRAYCGSSEDVVMPVYRYLIRNRHIVQSANHGIIAAPHDDEPHGTTRGNGTWTTVRYARQAKRRIWIVAPDGTFREENHKETNQSYGRSQTT